MKLSEYAIKNPITAIMTTLSVMVLGGIALFRLPLMYAPDLSWPAMYIHASYPSSSPEEVEQKIARPVEEIMGTLSGVKALSSRSSSGSASIRLEFDYGTDMDLAALHVRDRLDQVRDQLPDDLERIEVRRWSTDDWPIMQYSLTWLGDDKTELASIAKNTIVPRLQRLEGVGSVDLRGIDEKALLVSADQGLLYAHNLDVRTLSYALRANNQNVSAGYVDVGGKRIAVRSVGEFQNVNQIRHLPLRGDVELKDVADVTYDFPEKKYFERLDGRDAVTMAVRKSSTANMVATALRVKREMDRIVQEVGPDKLNVHLIRDSSVDVTQGIRNLAVSALSGGLLAVLVIFLFLKSFRSTVIIGSAIPISVLCVFVIMYLLRQFCGSAITLNLVSMMGLMVAVGMLVDPAVVTLENIYRKRYEDGQDAWTAATEGSREIGMPVVAGALTTVCVFVPVVFVGGSGGSLWMKDFATTVCISVMASLAVALSLIPLGGSRAFTDGYARADRYIKAGGALLAASAIGLLVHWEGPRAVAAWLKGNTLWVLGGIKELPLTTWIGLLVVAGAVVLIYWQCRSGRIKVLYRRLVRLTLVYRWSTVLLASLVLVFGFYIYSKVPKQRFRYQPTRRVSFNLDLPRSYDINDALALFESIENTLIPRKKELDIKAVSTRFSGSSGSINLYLVPAEEGQLSTDEVKIRVKKLLPMDLPGVVYRARHSSDGVATVGLEIKGRNEAVLSMLAEDIRLRMQDLPKAQEVETSLESGQEEIRVSINRQRAQRYGLSPRQIATTIATALGSRGNSKFKTDEREIDIRLQLKEEDRATLEQLKNTVFESDNGGMISFASMADFNLKRGPQSIERQDRMSTVEVYATTEQADRYLVGMEMARRIRQIPMPEGYSWQMDRHFRRATKEQGETNFTYVFAALLIYLIMASLFESYVHPFTIMFSIWFAFTGVAFGLYLLKVPMDRNATYGVLILFGIVVNNGIVLVDHINRYRKMGLCRPDAIVRGGQDRLRPIAMTAITTILGLTPLVIPMLYGTAEGFARTWGPIGLVVICGLTLSTVLTLVLLPTIYSLMDDLAGYARRVVATASRVTA